ncbi:unnamed protein product [Toxocara canis]|uniref:Ovule protein n=1 Tax=Toxocara canis TaxID=6265 RepID=A0A183U515_TOXCA|nr:unnamed protein product [Toxocara canis]
MWPLMKDEESIQEIKESATEGKFLRIPLSITEKSKKTGGKQRTGSSGTTKLSRCNKVVRIWYVHGMKIDQWAPHVKKYISGTLKIMEAFRKSSC